MTVESRAGAQRIERAGAVLAKVRAEVRFCSGQCRAAAKRRLTSMTLAGSESLSETQYRVNPTESSNSQCSSALASIGPIESSAANSSRFAGSTEPQFTPIRRAMS